MRRHSIHIALVILACLLTFASCQSSRVVPSVTVRSSSELRREFVEDLQLIRRYDESLTDLISYAKGRSDLFGEGDGEEPRLGLAERRELRTIWRSFLDYIRAIDTIKQDWDEYRRAVDEERGDAIAFLVGYTAWMVQYRHGLEFVALSTDHEDIPKILDEGSSAYDLPAGAFGDLRRRLIGVESLARRTYYHQYLATQRGTLSEAQCSTADACQWAIDRVEEYHEVTGRRLDEEVEAQWTGQTFDFMRDVTFDAWFPVQREVAEWMGDTRVRRKDTHLVDDEQIRRVDTLLSPGDILVTRQNWYLSNVGLPGFWPHSAFYVGSPEELADFFDTPEVREAMATLSGEPESLISYLRRTHPEAWSAFSTSSDPPRRVIEAVSEGVVFHPIEKTAAVDYLAAIRPNKTKAEKALAVAQAFGFHGREYDFNFDFVTDDVIVCTELIYKSWQTPSNPNGLPFEPVEMMGRPTLPANELVRQFDATYEEDDGPFEFVYFLDGRERDGRAYVRDVNAFRKSWKRPRWDVAQE